MICPHCGATVATSKKFCGDCGAALPWQCETCGSKNPADKRFCGDCGAARAIAPRTPQPAAPAPERRLLSVMMIDLVGSTALGQRLDPEDLRETIAAFHAHVTGLLGSFDAFVARYMGDGLLVYFGYPQANETDAERAVRAGLTIADAVARLDTVAGPPGTLKVRIGIDSGLVVVGDLIGFGASLEAAVVGDTPNLATRLQSAADPSTVVISDATHMLVGSLFECRELSLPNLKGRRSVERAWVVLGQDFIDRRYEALRRGQLSLVNRTEELEVLLRRWEQAKAGEGRVLHLTGEPGIGKSRLIAALEQYVAPGSNLSLRFHCSPHHLDTPLYPIIRHVERAAKFQRGDTADEKLDKLASVLPPGASAEDKALLADLLTIPSPGMDLLQALTPHRRKTMTFAVILRQIEALARQQPTLAVLEDIHWADPTTLELLDLLIEAIRPLRVLLVITARPEVRPAWAGRPHVTVQMLSGLDDRTAATLVKQVAGGRELPQRIIDRIITHADNVPLFIEELTKTVLERPLQANDGGNRASSMEQISVDMVPTSLHSSLMARLDRLPAGKDVAQIGSVIGREFSFEIAQAVSQLPASDLEHALAELAKSDIIVARGQPPLATYTFKHALVQDAAYASMLRNRRRAIHNRLAEELEKNTGGEAAEPQLIAWHFAEASVATKSIEYYQKAADLTTGRFALAEMVHHLRNGLRQIPDLPESKERQRRELALQLALGQSLIDYEGADSDGVGAAYERARELCLALDETELLPRVYDGLVLNYHFIHAQPETMRQYTSEMVAVHERTRDPQALLMTRRAGCLANMLLGRFEPAREEMLKILEMYQPDRDRPSIGMSTRDPKVSTCTFLGICLTILGYPDSGAAMSLSGVQHAQGLNHPVSLNLGLRRACVLGMLQRDIGKVVESSSQLIALRESYETYKGSWEGTLFSDWAKLCVRFDPVIFDRVQAFLHHLDATRNWAMLPIYMVSVAELSGGSGDTAAAVMLLERAAELASATGARWCEPEIIRLRARFAAHDADEAATMLQSSLALASEQGAKLWELRAAADLAQLLRDRGDHTGARQLLKPICDWFSEGAGMPDLVAARTLLAGLGR
jgi:class 3 adenylate cyclase